MPLEAFVTVKYLNGFLSKLEEKKKKYENTHTQTNQNGAKIIGERE